MKELSPLSKWPQQFSLWQSDGTVVKEGRLNDKVVDAVKTVNEKNGSVPQTTLLPPSLAGWAPVPDNVAVSGHQGSLGEGDNGVSEQ